MFPLHSSDSELIYRSLLMWRNWIQTGNVLLSTEDLTNMGKEENCKQLNHDQHEFVIRLEELAASQLKKGK